MKLFTLGAISAMSMCLLGCNSHKPKPSRVTNPFINNYESTFVITNVSGLSPNAKSIVVPIHYNGAVVIQDNGDINLYKSLFGSLTVDFEFGGNLDGQQLKWADNPSDAFQIRKPPYGGMTPWIIGWGIRPTLSPDGKTLTVRLPSSKLGDTYEYRLGDITPGSPEIKYIDPMIQNR